MQEFLLFQYFFFHSY